MLAYIVILIFAAVLQVGAFWMMGFDKAQAGKRHAERVPERRFVWLALFGALPGLLLAASWYRHKTSKLSFWLKVVPAGMLGLAVLYGWVWLFRTEI